MEWQKKFLVVQNGKVIYATEHRARIFSAILKGKLSGEMVVYKRVSTADLWNCYAYEVQCKYNDLRYSYTEVVGG